MYKYKCVLLIKKARMFIDNKYKKWYFSIIYRANQRCISIYEKHHIIPKSLGGSNDIFNLVKLSPKEHFICHHLLTKFTIGDAKTKMAYAFWSMTRNSKHTHRKFTAKQYQTARNSFTKTVKGISYDARYGTERSIEIRKKKSSVTKGISRPWAGSDGLNKITGHNRNAKVWQITTPDGIINTLIGAEFTNFCNLHNLSKGNLSSTGKSKGYTVKCLGAASKFMDTAH